MSELTQESPQRRSLERLARFLAETKENRWTVELLEDGAWPKAPYRMTERMLHALRAAIGSGRALLVKGEPGAGKSHLARAAATICERDFIATVVQPNTEYEDLLWRIDHVERLGEAQRLGARAGERQRANGEAGTVDEAHSPVDSLAIERFVRPGPLWFAFDPLGEHLPEPSRDVARGRITRSRGSSDSTESRRGTVLLVDEIDKADASLCNGLLEALGNGGFDVPFATGSVRCADDALPLIVLTSNDLRALPTAFLRRCVVLDLPIREEEELLEWLVTLGRTHFGAEISAPTLKSAAQRIVSERDSHSAVRAGAAEYLDLLRAIARHGFGGDESAEGELLDAIAAFFHKSD